MLCIYAPCTQVTLEAFQKYFLWCAAMLFCFNLFQPQTCYRFTRHVCKYVTVWLRRSQSAIRYNRRLPSYVLQWTFHCSSYQVTDGGKCFYIEERRGRGGGEGGSLWEKVWLYSNNKEAANRGVWGVRLRKVCIWNRCPSIREVCAFDRCVLEVCQP